MFSRVRTSRNLLAPVMAVALLLAITTVPAGRGHLGGASSLNFNQGDESLTTLTDGQVSLVIGTRVFTYAIDPNGDTLTEVRQGLMDAINVPGSPYNATVSTDPFDPATVAFEVLQIGGAEIGDMQFCETSSGLDELAAYIACGREVVLIDRPTTVNANGTYSLTIRQAGGPGMPFMLTYNTSAPPNNTAAGLVASLTSDLTASGYTVLLGTNVISIRKTGVTFTWLEVVATDTGITTICTKLEPSVNVVPTLSQYGFFGLVVLMTAAAVMMLRRKSRETGAPAGS